MTGQALQRSRDNRMIAGVMAGLARYLGVDVTVLRIIYTLVTVFSGAFPGIVIYLILWLLMPLAAENPPP